MSSNTSSAVLRKRKKQSPWQAVDCLIRVAITNQPERACPAWAILGNPYVANYCREITLNFNSAHWPTAGALQRRDFRVLRWLGACALLERLVVSPDPLPKAAGLGLATLALVRAPETFERCAWAAYQLMDHDLFQKLETLSIFAGATDGNPTAVLGSFSYKFRSDVLKEWLSKHPPSGRQWRIQK
jgi:hypothetical protein